MLVPRLLAVIKQLLRRHQNRKLLRRKRVKTKAEVATGEIGTAETVASLMCHLKTP
jgi:hypothetical protein